MSVSAGRPVGRDRELVRLRRLADGAASGCGGLVLVAGDAGIGKTCLVRHAVDGFGVSGFDVFTGEADPGGMRWPFDVIVDALDRRLDPDSHISALIAATDRCDRPTSADTALDVELRVVDFLTRRLRTRCATTRVVLVLEDLHWADPASLAAIPRLGRLAVDLPLLVVCTLRPESRRPEVAQFIATMARRDIATIEVSALTDGAVAELATAGLGCPPGPTVRRLLRAAGGNPLFVTELIRAIATDPKATTSLTGAIDLPEDYLPPAVVTTVMRQLRTLPPDTLEVLRAASLLGPTFSVTELKLAVSRSTAELAAGLRPAREAGLLVESEDRLAFRYELVRTVIYHEIPRAVRTSWHRDLAEALERTATTADHRTRPQAEWRGLTPAQRTVAGLLAQGLSNTEIAERLYVSRRTVESHVSAALHKLGMSSRLQLAATASRHFVR